MNLLLILLAFVPRPNLAPVNQTDVDAAELRRAELSSPETHRSSLIVHRSPAELFASPSRIPGRYVLGFNDHAEAAAQEWANRHGGDVARVDRSGRFLVVEFGGESAAQDELLRASAGQTEGLRYFEPDLRVTASAIPNDPYFIPYQWDKWVTYADKAWDLVGGGMNIRLAVVDNGTDWQHPDLAANFVQGDLGYDFIGNDNDPRPDNTQVPESFHGTHVAGIIAATRNNQQGIAGWAQVQLLAVRVLNDSGSGTTSVLASGINWAVDHGAKIVNMSLGGGDAPTPLVDACRYASQASVLLIAATGNEGQLGVNFPAALSYCIAVGATGPESRRADFSNYGPEVELAAPGVTVASCMPGGGYVFADGTSMAAPQVSGVAALVLAANFSLNAAGVRAVLDESAIDMGPVGRDQNYGFGLVNAKRAVDLATLLGDCPRKGTVPRTSGRVTIVRRGSKLPAWVSEAEVYDGSGRLIQAGVSGFRPGTYFVRAQGLSPNGDCPQSHRLLVLD